MYSSACFRALLHIMCGYQCDKAVNKNHEMISYHFKGLNCPIKWIVIIWLDRLGCTLDFRF